MIIEDDSWVGNSHLSVPFVCNVVEKGGVNRYAKLKSLGESQNPDNKLHEKGDRFLTCAQDSSKMSPPRPFDQSDGEVVADSFQQLFLSINHKEINGLSIFKPPLYQPPHRRMRKKLLILDINGVLVDIVSPPPKERKADINIARHAVFKRPFYLDFMKFCFERFEVGIWSSRNRIFRTALLQDLILSKTSINA